MTGRSDDPPPVALAPEVIHVGFGSHHVVVRSASPRVTADLRTAFGPMLIDAPTAIETGVVEAIPTSEGIRITGGPDAEAPAVVNPEWAPREAYHAVVKLLMRARDDLVWIHAGVAAYEGRSYLFAGPSGQGKSTLVAALLDRGWTYLSDEIAAIDASSGAANPFPLAPRRRVHEGDFAPLDDADAIRTLRKVAVEFPSRAVARHPLPLKRICFLRYMHSAQSIDVAECAPAQSVLELLRNSLSIGADREREIARLAQLVERVPAVQITYSDAERVAAKVHADVTGHPATVPLPRP